MIKVLGFPYADMTSASARIRFWHRLDSIKDLVQLKVYSVGDNPADYDVVYVQKRVNPFTITLVEAAKKFGTPVVFDIDDAIGTAASTDMDIAMMRAATEVTTDTRFKSEIYSPYLKKSMRVIPDGLDYFTEWFDLDVRSGVESVCTFGWEHNVAAAASYLCCANTSIDRVGYISNVKQTSTEYENIPFIQWSVNTFIDEVQKFDCAILAHGDKPADRMRCCNRLMTAIFAGLLPIVKNSLEYTETARVLGMPQLIAQSPEDAVNIVRSYGQDRAAIVRELRKKVWEMYRPRVQGLALHSIFKDVASA